MFKFRHYPNAVTYVFMYSPCCLLQQKSSLTPPYYLCINILLVRCFRHLMVNIFFINPLMEAPIIKYSEVVSLVYRASLWHVGIVIRNVWYIINKIKWFTKTVLKLVSNVNEILMQTIVELRYRPGTPIMFQHLNRFVIYCREEKKQYLYT